MLMVHKKMLPIQPSGMQILPIRLVLMKNRVTAPGQNMFIIHGVMAVLEHRQ